MFGNKFWFFHIVNSILQSCFVPALHSLLSVFTPSTNTRQLCCCSRCFCCCCFNWVHQQIVVRQRNFITPPAPHPCIFSYSFLAFFELKIRIIRLAPKRDGAYKETQIAIVVRGFLSLSLSSVSLWVCELCMCVSAFPFCLAVLFVFGLSP